MYDTIKTNQNDDIKGEDIAELKMYEYSTVALGAYPDTPLLDIKSFGVFDLVALEKYLSRYDVSESKAKQIQELIKALKEPTEATPITEPVTLADPQLGKYIERFNKAKR
jgi:hypothetical protein